jgi:hypothetical protein
MASGTVRQGAGDPLVRPQPELRRQSPRFPAAALGEIECADKRRKDAPSSRHERADRGERVAHEKLVPMVERLTPEEAPLNPGQVAFPRAFVRGRFQASRADRTTTSR